METSNPTPQEAAAALAGADVARAGLAAGIVLPPAFHTCLAAAVTGQIATTAVGVAVDAVWARALLALGVAAFAAVAAAQLVRFRRVNGVWLGPLAGQVVLGSARLSSTGYGVALAAAVWAALQDLWWLVGPCAVAGGAVYALSGRRWLREYRLDPEQHGIGHRPAQLVALAAVAVAGLVVAVVLS